MSATNDAVFHRRNKQIQDAIDGQNLKQALQLIEKRMKKGEDSRFLKAWKAEILYRHADDAHRQRGLTETLELCKLEPPTTDLDTLEILQETLQKIGGQEDTMRSLWEKAAKAKPQDLEVQLRWFSYAFEADDWKSAQKAAMSLQSNFPKTRKYYFWAIFLSYLVAVDKNSSEAERKLFGTLAYRMASKAADSVPADPKELLSTPRAIQNAEELLLLIKICESQRRHSEVVKLLDSQNLGLSSRIVQNDWPFVGEKLSGLEKAEMWAEGLSYARNLLAIPTNESEEKTLQERDDWAVWSLLIHSVQNIKNEETTAETRKFIDEFIKAVPRSRNAQLARLDLIDWSFKSGSLKSHELITACQEYFDRNKTKLYCFVDLRKYLSDLDKASLTEFIQYASRTAGIQGDENDPFKDVPAINALKLEYCFLLSADAANATQPKVEDYVSRCLQIFRSAKRPERTAAGSTIESQPSDDLCLLAAMSLIRFSGGWTNEKPDQVPDTSLIRAAGILERLLLDSPHNYNALLLLVRIYLRLGAGSLALRTFSKLSVKQLQYETVAHNLFTRLATIHPHSAPPVEGAEYKDFYPQSAFVQALNFYRTADVTTVRNRTNGLEYGSYANVEGTIDLQRRLKHSICRKMWALDVKRLQRLAGGDNMGRYSDLARETSPTVDQRVFDAFMNCEAPGQTTFEERVRLGPLPKEHWVKSAQLTDQLFELLKNLAAQKPVSAEFDVPSLDDLLSSDAESEMTAPEIESVRLHVNLLKVAKLLSGSKSVNPEEVDICLSQVEQWLESRSKDFALDSAKLSPVMLRTAVFLRPESPSAPSWKYLHDTFLVLESLKALSFIYTIASRKGPKTAKLPKDRVEKLGGLIGEVYDSVRANIRALKSRVSEPGMLGSLVDLVLAGGQQLRTELEKTLDMPAVELVCAYVVITFEADKYGNGIHIWEVDESDLRRYSKWANTSQIVYGPLIFITKLSILLLYLRVFAPSFRSKTFFCIHALIWLNFGFYFADTIVKIFECSPRAKIWDKTLKGHCININIPIIVTSSINVASDFLILVLPIVSVWRLQMRNSKKLGTSMIFAAGIFIMRLVVSVQNRTVEDKTYDWFPEFLWTHFFKRACALISNLTTSYSSRSAKRAIEVISWPTSWSVRQKKQSSGGHSMTELCQSTNCELDDIEQQPEEHTGRIFSGASYTTAGAQAPSRFYPHRRLSTRQLPSSNHRRRQTPVTTVEMAQERSGIVVGLNKGHKTTPFNTPKTRISRTKGQSSRRTAFVRDIAREVAGLAPYERRIIELLRNTQDKRARKLAKKRLGTFSRGKKKVEDMQRVIAESRRVTGH
ncbi:hypothetical protein KXW63_008960 [Aspergillus fumigatus]|nr:hypothetical protein KXW63_008960 [Aspergillus fumigatus]